MQASRRRIGKSGGRVSPQGRPRRVKAGRTRLVLLRDSYHMISLDREKQRVIDEIGGFLALLDPPRNDIESRRPKVVPLGRHGTIQGA